MATTTATPARTTATRAFPLKYIGIAFAFTWTFWLLTLLEARGLISSLPVPALFLGAFGPMVAAVAITAQEGGRAGLRSLLSRVLRWVGAIVLVLVYGATNLSRRPRQVLADAGGESRESRVQ